MKLECATVRSDSWDIGIAFSNQIYLQLVLQNHPMSTPPSWLLFCWKPLGSESLYRQILKTIERLIAIKPVMYENTGKLGYDGLNGTRKIGPSYAKSITYIWHILDMHETGTKHIVRHSQKSAVQWSVMSKFTCIVLLVLDHYSRKCAT